MSNLDLPKPSIKASVPTAAMLSFGYSDFNVFDGQNAYERLDYEQSRRHQSGTSDINSAEQEPTQEDASLITDNAVQKDSHTELQDTTLTVYSCIRNGTSTAQAGYGLFWGDEHPWNCSHPLPQDNTATNHKAELAAAVKAIQVAREHNLEKLIVYSDSNYVIQGVTE